MPDAFISYSRKNIAFARLLIDALEANGIQAWIDWQDIPPVADWLAEVYEAIESSDAFIFIISENSVISEVCRQEIQHAAQNHKRLIPIVVNEVEPGDVPASLRALQWIFFTQEDHFGNAVQDLISALQTDQEWVRGHTRLQNRALQWQRRERPGSSLLRGQDLARAETWLSQTGGKDPAPTPLQTDFIFASRREANRRRQAGGVLAVLGIILAGVLSFWAWTQRVAALETTHSRATAESLALGEAHTRATAQAEAEQEEHARATAQSVLQDQILTVSSRTLAGQALVNQGEHIALGLLLSIEALNIEDTLDARYALFQSLLAHPHLEKYLLHETQAKYRDIYLDPQGNLILNDYDGKQLLFYDPVTGERIRRLDVEESITSRRFAGLPNVSQLGIRFSEDGSKMLILDSKRRWLLYDTTSYSLIGEAFSGEMDTGMILAISPNFDRLATVEEGDIQVWNSSGGEIFRITDLPGEIRNEAFFNIDLDVLVVPLGERLVRVYDLDSGDILLDYELPEAYGSEWGLEMDPLGMRLGMSGSGQLILLDLISGEELWVRDRQKDAGYKFAFSPDGAVYLAYSRTPFNPDKERYDAEYTYLERILPAPALLSRFSPLSFDNFEEMGQIDDTYHTLFQMDPLSLRIVSYRSALGTAEILVFNPSRIYPILESVDLEHKFEGETRPLLTLFHPLVSDLLATAECDRGVKDGCILTLWDLSNNPASITGRREVDAEIITFAFHPSSQNLVVGMADGSLAAWDWASDGWDNLVPDGSGPAEEIMFSPDGQYLAAIIPSESPQVKVWNYTPGTSLGPILPVGVGGTVSHIAFHPVQNWLGIAAGDQIELWDLNDDRRLAVLTQEGIPNVYERLAFHPDGDQIVSSGDEGFVRWDLSGSKPLLGPEGSFLVLGEVQFLGYDPVGSWLVVGMENNVHLYDPETGKLMGELSPSNPEATEKVIAFDLLPRPSISADGAMMTVYERGHDLLFWQLDLESWQKAACRVANRNLTHDEWKTYLGDVSYRETCP